MALSTRKAIGYGAAISIVIGSIIGSGIFRKPATMAAQLSSPEWLIVVWVIAGLFSLFGALIYAEIGAMIPENGGTYVYFKKMYGDFTAFLYGWAAFSAINTASVSAIAFVFAAYANFFLHLPRLPEAVELEWVLYIPYLGKFYPFADIGVKSLAILLVVGLTAVNYISERGGSILQLISTVVKVVVISALIFGIFFSGGGEAVHITTPSMNPKEGWQLLGGFVAALTGAFMAYEGWINLTFVAGEVRDPQKNIPRSLIIGVVTCIIIYVLINLAYLYVLPIDAMKDSKLVASDAIRVALGSTSEAVIAALIVLCTLGAVNGNVMSIAWVTFAMARDGRFMKWAGKEHPRFKTPGNALVLHGILASLFILSGTFDILSDMYTFASWVAYLLAAIGLFVLRRKMPNANRPYRVWGYPVVPVLFILFASFYVVSTIVNDVNNYINGTVPVINSLFGLAIIVAGTPLFWYFKRKYPQVPQ